MEEVVVSLLSLWREISVGLEEGWRPVKVIRLLL